jgi:hypothetical protein
VAIAMIWNIPITEGVLLYDLWWWEYSYSLRQAINRSNELNRAPSFMHDNVQHENYLKIYYTVLEL